MFEVAGPKIGIGTKTPKGKLGISTSQGIGLAVSTSNSGGVAISAMATNTGTTSSQTGLDASAPGPHGAGVRAFGGIFGVFAQSSDSGFGAVIDGGILGLQARGRNGSGILAITEQAGSFGADLQNRAGGNLLRGRVGPGPTPTTVFRVDGTGRGFFDGGTQVGGADFAESMAVRGQRQSYAPGDLLVIDTAGNRQLAIAQEPYSTLVAGIYSTKPGILATAHRMDDARVGKEVPLAVVGIVPCKVSAENGPIAVGDLLVSSSTPGHAMKGVNRAQMLGAVVGKALEPLPTGKGVIQVLVTLQ
jgi:hypothetical protein